MIQRKYVQYTWRTMLHIIHDNNWIHKWSRWIKMLCQLIISSAFFSIFFRQVIMNIDFVKMIEHLDNREDYYRSYNQKIMILQVIQQIFCEILIGGRKIVNSDMFLESLIPGKCSKAILRSLKGKFTELCQRNPLWAKKYVALMVMVKENYALCLHTWKNSWG